MKKPKVSILVAITCIFAAFVVGFFAGRNLNHTPVQISALPVSATENTQPAASVESTVPTEPGILNINTATVEQLQTLPGIGPVLAQRIVDYRDTYGDFQAIEELTKVSGIGTKRFEAIWDMITVGG